MMETFFCHACCAETGATPAGAMCYLKKCDRCGKTAYCIQLAARPPAAAPVPPAAAPVMDEATADLRDSFAAAALMGLLASMTADDGGGPDEFADTAYDYADAMLRRRAKP